MSIWNFLRNKIDFKHTEHLSNLEESYSSISNMIALQNKLININGNIEIDLKDCSKISPANIMILSSISLLKDLKNQKTVLTLNKDGKLIKYLTEINFVNGPLTKNFNMALKPFKTEDDINIIINEIISSSKFTSIDVEERYIIISKVYELLINSCEHGYNDIGAICHCFYKNNKFNFSVYDFGQGIPKVVKEFLNAPNMTDIDTIEWALSAGNSTKLTNDSIYPRGSGLKLIEKFLNDYKGRLIICSGFAYYSINASKVKKYGLNTKILGTLITLSVPIQNKSK